MQKPLWNSAVTIGAVLIPGPFEALSFLDHDWPNHKGPRFVDARFACLAALDERGDPEDAKTLFTEALAEAQLH